MMKNPIPEALATRTRRFALAIVRLYAGLPRSTVSYILGRQLLKSGTSVGAQYREARRAKSNADFISKVEGALQELDESAYWLELMRDAGIAKSDVLEALAAESDELIAIFVSIVKRAKTSAV
jgi:four helix bundle protein